MRHTILVATVIGSVLLAGCTSGDTSQTGDEPEAGASPAGADQTDGRTATGGSASAACDAFVAYEQAFDIEEDLEAGLAGLEEFVAAAPDEVADLVEPIIPLLKQDPGAAMESEEVAVADQAASEFAFDRCGDARFEVEAHNFAFTGAPTQLVAGRVAFRLTNQTQTGEFHEALILRRAEDGEGSGHELLAAGLATPISVETTLAAFEPFEFLGVGFVEPDGNTDDVFVLDLQPGDYVVACLLPVNSDEQIEAYFGGQDVEGERHFDLGMYWELTVE